MFERLFGKKEVPVGGTTYRLECEIHPFRLPAHKIDSVDMEVTVTNDFDRELLTSLVVEVPKGLGFEQSALSQEREIRLGVMRPSETKMMKISVWGTQRTEPGLYPIKLYAISHYHDYGYVLNEVKRVVGLRAV